MKCRHPTLRKIGIDRYERALEWPPCQYPVDLSHGCGHRFLVSFAYQGPELGYCDTPCLHARRSSDRCCRFGYEDGDHLEMLGLLKTLPRQVNLSGYPSGLYYEQRWGLRSVELQVINQSGVHTGKLRFNARSDRADRARYARRNHTHLRTIKRPTKSWARRHAWMPQAERLAVLSGLMAVEAAR